MRCLRSRYRDWTVSAGGILAIVTIKPIAFAKRGGRGARAMSPTRAVMPVGPARSAAGVVNAGEYLASPETPRPVTIVTRFGRYRPEGGTSVIDFSIASNSAAACSACLLTSPEE
jgi:hypothetical protein